MEDLIVKKNQKIDVIFISHYLKIKKIKSFGVIKFNLINKNSNNRIIALGGINENNKNMLVY